MSTTLYQELEQRVKAKCRAKGTNFGSIEAKAILEVVADLLEGGTFQTAQPAEVDTAKIDEAVAVLKEATERANKAADEALEAAEVAKAIAAKPKAAATKKAETTAE